MISYLFYFETLRIVLAFMALIWVLSLIKNDASLADPFWPLGFLLISGSCLYNTWQLPTMIGRGEIILLSLLIIWALRLFSYLLMRNLKGGKNYEDKRYQAFRRHYGEQRYWWISFFQVFMLQGFLLWLISLPIQWYLIFNPTHEFNLLGLFLMIIGLLIESLADWQLFSNKQEGKIYAGGLWKYSRHPNYFGESVFWWGLFIYVQSYDFSPITLISPILISAILFWQSTKSSKGNKWK